MDAWMDKCSAFCEALRQLDVEYPPDKPRKEADRRIMHHYIKARALPAARMFAIISGIPKERIEAIEALIF